MSVRNDSGANQTAVDAPPSTLNARFAEWVSSSPEAVAVIAGGSSLTYGALDRRSNQLARHLLALGVGRGDRVGVIMTRSTDLMVALLGVLKTGACYVPVDPGYPEERIAFICEDAAMAAVVTESALAADVALEVPLVRIDGDAAALDLESSDPLDVTPSPDDLCYVIYTSGSTGRPKGVMIEHAGVVNLLDVMAVRPGLAAGEVMVGLTTPAFDLSVPDLFLPILSGATLVLASAQEARDPFALAHLFEEARADLVQATPATWRMLLESGWEGRPTMRVVCGGEGYGADLVEALAPKVAALWNFYGPTETTVWSVCTELSATTSDPVPMGRPIANTTCYVLDEHGDPVPLGSPGELYLGGMGLARGYLGRDELTAERFVPNPFSEEPASRLYRTGDLVRYRADGSLVFLGRTDHQVKLRGYRIELGEIESALRNHPSVAQAVVVVRQDPLAGPQLVAYVVTVDDQTVGSDVLRDHVGRRLPTYMVPSAVVTLDAFPLTPNGKLDRAALPAPPSEGAAEGREFQALTLMERTLVGLWSGILGTTSIEPDDDFFQLGGHSLAAVRLVARIADATGVVVSPQLVFETPRLSDLAASIDRVSLASGPDSGPTAADRDAHRVHPGDLGHADLLAAAARGQSNVVDERLDDCFAFPMSPGQQRMWFLEQLQPEVGLYNMPFFRRVSGELSVDTLSKALTDLVARHEVLRTTYSQPAGEPVQIVHPPSPLKVVVSPRAPDAAEALERCRLEFMRPFDLLRGPQLRAFLVPYAENEALLGLGLHHIAVDGWSFEILLRDLDYLYRSHRDGTTATLPELAVQYGDVAVWQNSPQARLAADEQLDYWRAELAGAPPTTTLPYDRPRQRPFTHQGARRFYSFAPETYDSLRTLCRDEGVTPFVALTASVAYFLAIVADKSEVVLGTPIAGRDHPAVADVAGLFINTLPLRIHLDGKSDYRSVLTHVRETLMNGLAHQEVPFERVVEALNPPREAGRHPIFQIMVDVQAADRAPKSLGDHILKGVVVEKGPSRFDLGLTFVEGTELRVTNRVQHRPFRRGDHRPGRPKPRNTHPQRVQPPARPTQPRRAPFGQRAHTGGCRLQRHRPALREGRAVHDLFVQQVARTPDAVACEFGEDRLTYRELDAATNGVAAQLEEAGVAVGEIVGVCLDRSLAMPIALLGVLKAGAAYLPLDPSYPEERLRFMVEDASVRVVVTAGPEATGVAGVIAGAARVLTIDGVQEGDDAGPSAVKVTGSDLCYVIYTSGSTGTPKGVLVEHEGVVNLVHVVAETFQIDQTSRVLQFASPSFDASVTELLIPLCVGATVCGTSKAVLSAGPDLLRFMADHRITTATLPPSFLAVFGDAELPDLKTLCSAGEACPPDVAGRWAPGRRFLNGYGPTEATVAASYHVIEGGFADPGEQVPIGRPIANAQIYIVDDDLEPNPIGVPGEICIGGVGIARGYLGRDELTAARFIPDPFSTDAHARLYRTGDRGRWRPDGILEFLGRFDDQVKLHGYRIELGEIEQRLRDHPNVRDAAVIVREDVPGLPRLVAYVVPTPDHERKVELWPSLAEYLAVSLPSHMIPSVAIELDLLPLSANGKVVTARLPAPREHLGGQETVNGSQAEAEPSGQGLELRSEIARVYGDVLGIDPPGFSLDFFDLGGTSLLATKLFTRIEAEFDVQLPLAVLFECATVDALAEQIEAVGAEGTDVLANGEPPDDEFSILVTLQKGQPGSPTLFLVHQNTGRIHVYRDLVRALPGELSIYGLQAEGLDRKTTPLDDIPSHGRPLRGTHT